jgi:hypothetical protein
MASKDQYAPSGAEMVYIEGPVLDAVKVGVALPRERLAQFLAGPDAFPLTAREYDHLRQRPEFGRYVSRARRWKGRVLVPSVLYLPRGDGYRLWHHHQRARCHGASNAGSSLLSLTPSPYLLPPLSHSPLRAASAPTTTRRSRGSSTRWCSSTSSPTSRRGTSASRSLAATARARRLELGWEGERWQRFGDRCRAAQGRHRAPAASSSAPTGRQ